MREPFFFVVRLPPFLPPFFEPFFAAIRSSSRPEVSLGWSVSGTIQTLIRSVKHPDGLKQAGCGR